MNARRKMSLVAIVVAPLVAIAAACTFPDVTFGPAGGTEAGAEAGASDSPTGDAMVDGDARRVGANEDVDPTGATMDATTVPDGGQRVDAGPDGCCDCDMDQFMADSGNCSVPTTTPDCDDLNPYIHPMSGYVNTPTFDSLHTPQFDWNCDGVRTKQYDYNQKCDDPNNCNGKSGFNDDPNCGETTTFNNCKYNPGVAGVLFPSCSVGTTSQVTQGCK